MFSGAILALLGWFLASDFTASFNQTGKATQISITRIPKTSAFAVHNLSVPEDPLFSITAEFGDEDISPTSVFMSAVELLAQYAEKDFMSKIRRRQGPVLPEYPQIEIAVIPYAPTTSVPVRFVIWAIYYSVINMVTNKLFKENEITLFWSGQLVAHVYITKPLDAPPEAAEQVHNLSIALQQTSGNALEYDSDNSTADLTAPGFSWVPIYKPTAKNVQPKDVFLIAMGTMKTIAESAMTEKVPKAFGITLPAVDANMQFYLQDRRTPRTTPPYFLYVHVLEAARRTPAWMLRQGRFAEFYCAILVYDIRVGQALLEKGPFDPGLNRGAGNISIA